MPNMILPGTYIEVRDEGLISAGRIATGNIGIVGTAAKGPVNQVQLISSLAEAREIFEGEGSDDSTQELTLVRALTLIYKAGGRNVYAVRTATNSNAAPASFTLTALGGAPVITLQAKTPGTWGNGITITITTLENSSGPPTDNPNPPSEENSNADEGGEASLPSEGLGSVRDMPRSSSSPQTQSQTPPARKVKAVISSSSKTESYHVESITELSESINADSTLVTATSHSSLETKEIPNTGLSETFTGGRNGEEATPTDYEYGLNLLKNEDVNIVLLAGQVSIPMVDALNGHLTDTAENKRERIGIVGSDFGEISLENLPTRDDGRLIFTAPGVLLTENGKQNKLPGGYLAAAVAGLISSLPVHSSPTNKVLSIEGLTTVFNNGQLEDLVQKRVCAVEQRNGFRIVKGITTSTGAWQQITTRRIVDYAIYGIRSSCDPYIGKLNNERVRGAMKATLDGFLTRMVEDEALVSYQLEVSATRAQEISGEAIVTVALRPTFSIDFIKVTMYLS